MPGHDAEKTTYGFQRFTSSPSSAPPAIRRLQVLADAWPRFAAPLHAQNGPPSDSNNHGFSADVSVWRGFVRRLMGSRFGGDIPRDSCLVSARRETKRHELLLSLGSRRHRRRRVSAWHLARWPEAGYSTPSTAIAGSIWARSAWR